GLVEGGVKTETPFEHISTDISGPIETSLYENSFLDQKIYIITFTDRCTNYSKIAYTTKPTSESIINTFRKEWFKIYLNLVPYYQTMPHITNQKNSHNFLKI
ncbi:putative transposable element, partial [Pseudoloma neurophilia]